MTSPAATTRSPARIELAELINLTPAGESINLAGLRVHALSAGGHLSPFKGRGVEFDESRPYQEGDDLRTIGDGLKYLAGRAAADPVAARWRALGFLFALLAVGTAYGGAVITQAIVVPMIAVL